MRMLGAATFFGFAGYSVLLPTAPLWAVHGGAGSAGAGWVNGVLLAATVCTQLLVPRLLHRFGWALVLGVGLALMGIGGALHLISDALPYVLALAALRGMGFGILTVSGSSAAGLLVAPNRLGTAVGAYGLAVAAPNLVLLPLGPIVIERWGFSPIFLASTLPLLGIPFVTALAGHLRNDPAIDQPSEASSPRPPAALLAPARILLGVTLAGGALLTFAAQLVTSAAAATWALLLLSLVTTWSRWRAGGLADRHGTGAFMLPLIAVTVVSMTLIAHAIRDPALPGLAYAEFLLGVTFLGLSYGALQNLTLVAAFKVVPRHQTHTASAVWNIGFDAGTALGSVLVGTLAAGLGFRRRSWSPVCCRC